MFIHYTAAEHIHIVMLVPLGQLYDLLQSGIPTRGVVFPSPVVFNKDCEGQMFVRVVFYSYATERSTTLI